MAYEIVWSDAAWEDVRDVFAYLQEAHSDRIANRFADELTEMLERLQRRPYIGKPHPSLSAVREVLIPPFNLLAYAVIRREIILLNLTDTRRNRQ